MSSVEEFLKRKIIEILKQRREGLVFDNLREVLEEKEGVYVEGMLIRRIVADMVREGLICREPSATLRRMLLRLCKN
uniref:Uncharacterized protein n=1 Tax=Ignisphaera aggregans TaxID=334771 RepID=A0A7J2U5E7_9CREN